MFGSLIQHIHDPFLIIDVKGKILSFNEEASELLALNDQKEDIFFYLDEASAEELRLVIPDKLTVKKTTSINVKFILQSGDELDATLILNSYKENEDELVFCRINKDKNSIVVNGKTKIIVRTEDYKEIIHNKDILNILEEIKSLYPFTYIGKEKVQRSINNLDELFWIQDLEGNYHILNDKLAIGLGIPVSQVEGKPVNSFLPAHLLDFQEALNTYLQKSLNCIIIEGIPLKNYGVNNNYQTIEIPLSDVDNNLLAIIGITQPVLTSNSEVGISDFFSSTNDLLQFLPKPLAIIDKNGIIKQATEEFRKLFENEIHDLRGLNYNRILPEDIVGKIDQFILSSTDKKRYEFYNQNKLKKRYSDEIILQLNKIYNDKFEFEGVSILFETIEEQFDLGKLFVRKGKMYELLIENNPDPIFIYDVENLRFLDVNRSALDLYGYNKDEFLQMDLTDLYTTEDIQSLLETSKNKLDEGKFSGPYRHKRKDGSSIFVELSKNSFKFEDKDAHFNVIRDVSERLELAKKNKSFDAVFNNNNNLIFVTDTNGFISLVNDTACKVLNRKKDDFADSSFASYLIDEDRGTVNTSVFKEPAKEEIILNIKMKTTDGGSFEAEAVAIPVLNYKDEIESFTIIVKKKEEPKVEIKEVIKEVIVEKTVESPTSSVPSEKIEPTFLSNLFHEILTPINVILGFTQDLTDSIKNLTPEQKESAEIINQNRERLLNTMNSVIEYSNIEKNKIDFDISTIAITEVIEYLDTNIKEITGLKDIEFGYGKISSSLKFKSDKAKFQQFINLLVKFVASVAEEKKIYFSAYPEGDKEFIVSVRDTNAHTTKHLMEFYKNTFINEKFETKGHGISKLNLRLAKALLTTLNGKAVISSKGSDESMFLVFPIEFSNVKKAEAIVEDNKRANKIEDAIVELEGESFNEEPEVKTKYRTIEDELDEIEAEDEISKESENELTSDVEPDLEEIKEEIIDTPVSSGSSLGKVELSQLRCLYIEDQVDSQILFKVQMKELKEIKFAVSFEEALPLLDSDNFDFIVIDINLQGEYNGLDALKLIQRMPNYVNVPIIAVTAYVLPGDKEKFIATGFNGFISKPIFKEKMIDSLEKIYSIKM